jgi:hypothetical protein
VCVCVWYREAEVASAEEVASAGEDDEELHVGNDI